MRIIQFTLFALLLACLPGIATAQAVPSQDLLSSRAGSVAVLRGLDKISAKTQDFEAPVNSTVTFGTLSITVNYCRKTPPEEKPEVYVFMNVKDRRTDGSGKQTDGEEIFSGWMFASNPALNALEHPIYDVWVLDCKG
ncbi:MAG: hypothetical protein COA84_00170 [Robiginitomaculum sp.]|nr:MAG: hypothetical protein COA84_00170 [Robiginitomaculum sp.]